MDLIIFPLFYDFFIQVIYSSPIHILWLPSCKSQDDLHVEKNISTTMFFLSALNNFRDEKLSDFLYSWTFLT